MRLFVAVFPPASALEHLAQATDALASIAARRSPDTRRHLTAAFLGEVAEEVVPRAHEALAAVPPHAVELFLAGGGAFGRGRSTVVWAGVGGDVDALGRVVRAVRRELRARRLTPDDRRFRPHLTLARTGDRVERATVRSDVDALRGYAGPSWSVRSLVLVHSELGPHPRYHELATHLLAP